MRLQVHSSVVDDIDAYWPARLFSPVFTGRSWPLGRSRQTSSNSVRWCARLFGIPVISRAADAAIVVFNDSDTAHAPRLFTAARAHDPFDGCSLAVDGDARRHNLDARRPIEEFFRKRAYFIVTASEVACGDVFIHAFIVEMSHYTLDIVSRPRRVVGLDTVLAQFFGIRTYGAARETQRHDHGNGEISEHGGLDKT